MSKQSTMNTNDIADLVAAVEYALEETEHYTDPNTGRPCVRLVRLDDETGLFAWLKRSKTKVKAQLQKGKK